MIVAKELNLANAPPVKAIPCVGMQGSRAARSPSPDHARIESEKFDGERVGRSRLANRRGPIPERGSSWMGARKDVKEGLIGDRRWAARSPSPEGASARRDARDGREAGERRGREHRSTSSERPKVKRGAEWDERAGKSRRLKPQDPSIAKEHMNTQKDAERNDGEVARDDGEEEAKIKDEMEVGQFLSRGSDSLHPRAKKVGQFLSRGPDSLHPRAEKVGQFLSRGPDSLHPRARMILQRRQSSNPAKLRLDLLEALSVQLVLERKREPVGYSLATPGSTCLARARYSTSYPLRIRSLDEFSYTAFEALFNLACYGDSDDSQREDLVTSILNVCTTCKTDRICGAGAVRKLRHSSLVAAEDLGCGPLFWGD
jgi:hypothetical protein